jgi:hypothetical protein
VLVPSCPVAEPVLARQAVSLAAPCALQIVYMGLAQSAAEESELRRRLANLAALTRTDQQAVDVVLSTERHWLAAVQAVQPHSDEVVCLAGQTTSGWGRRRPLAVALAAALHVVVHELDGVALPAPVARRANLGPAAGFVLVVVIFFLAQVQAIRLPAGAFQSALLIALVIGEFCLIAGWDKLNR